MRKILTILITLLIIVDSSIVSFGLTPPPEIIGDAAVIIDASTGQILYEKNMDKQEYPASTTKVMTAMLALENLDLSKTVTIDAITPFTEGSRIYLLEGERLTVEQLLNALLTESANDAAVALGILIAGSIPEFADMMNKKAIELGAKNTNFVNPNGLHNDAHITTAYDLALIAREAMKNEKFRELIMTYRYIIPATNKQDTRYLYNTNRLIYDEKTKVNVNGVIRPAKYDGVTGIKTGYTSKAGGCLIAGAKRGDTELIAVVLKSSAEGRFADAIALLDYGFENFKSAKAIGAGTDLGEIKVNRGSVKRVGVAVANDIFATIPFEASEEVVNTKVVLDDNVRAPVLLGQKVGTVEVYEGDKLVGEVDAITTSQVEEGGILSLIGLDNSTAEVVIKLVIAIFGLLLFLIFIYILLKRRQIKRKRMRAQARNLRIKSKEEIKNEYWRY